MQPLTYEQIRALHGRASLAQEPFIGRERKGERDAQNALAAILHLHAHDPAALTRNVRAYLAEGPAWDSQDYYDGGEVVHRDVTAVLDGNALMILDLTDALDTAASNRPAA